VTGVQTCALPIYFNEPRAIVHTEHAAQAQWVITLRGADRLAQFGSGQRDNIFVAHRAPPATNLAKGSADEKKFFWAIYRIVCMD
jgi:hypothetical protein